MTIMKSLFATILSFGILLGSPSKLFSADYSHNPTEVTVLSNNVAVQLEAQDLAIEAIANDVSSKVASNELARVTTGDEGIRRIGALGGYSLEEFLEDTYARGPARDKPQFVFENTNLTITYSDGDIYDPVNGYFKLDSGTKTLTDNAINYAYWSTTDVRIIQWTTGTRPNAINNIYLATFITSQGRIIYSSTSVPVGDMLLYEDAAFAQTFPSLILSGLNVYPTGTALTNIIINSGLEYHNLADRIEHPSVNLNTSSNLVVYTHSNLLWTSISTNKLLVGMWDNGTNLVSCDATKWYRGVFVSLNHSTTQLTWIAPDFEYASEADCLAGGDPDLPPAFTPYIPKCTAYVFKGDDTALRTDGTYWVDRRNSDNLLKGSVAGGSSGNTPPLGQVLLAGSDTGGILPSGMGLPVTDDQGASKGYVDSVGNKASTGTAFVDSETGDDNTARIEKASLPFKTIQAAINACGAVATDTKRFLISISIGTYSENITMSNYVSIRGYDMEATIIEGQVTYPTSYTDITGGEISILSVKMTNAPAFVFNAGSDEAYGGARSCAFYSTYDVDKPVKAVAQISRGNLEVYATCWFQLDVTNNITQQRPATIYYLTTDSGNYGTYQVNSFSSSHFLNVVDTNDTVSIVFCNSTNENFFASKSDATHIHLDDSENHDNRITTVVHKNAAKTRSFIDSGIVDIKLNAVNNCDVIAISSTGSVMGAVAHFNNSIIIVPNIVDGNLFYGSSSTTSDVIEIVNSQIGTRTASYPRRYNEAGVLGSITYFMQHGSGDLLLGGGMDMQAGIPSITPETGHVKLYTYTYAGLENPMFIDSASNKVRIARDSFFNGYNDEITPLAVGEVVYVAPGLSANGTPIVKRSNASRISTLPALGVVAQTGGIATGRIGRIMFFGRLENFMNTSAFASGDKLYVSDIVDGMLTNVLPHITNTIQQIATCHIVSPTNGLINVRPWKHDEFSQTTANWASGNSNTVNAKTIEGKTLADIQKQAIVYYVWGSSNGPVNGTKLATINTSSLLPSYSNVAFSVTNGQKLGAYSIPHEQLPTALQAGPLEIYANIIRTGDATTRYHKGVLSILEEDKTTVVASFTNATFVFPTVLSEMSYVIDIPYAIQINGGSNRLVKLEFFAHSGWTGTEDIKSYSQDGYLTRFRFQASPAGVFALQSDLDSEENRAIGVETNLQNQVNNNSNIVFNVNTNLQKQIDTTTNRVKNLETSLGNETNRAIGVETNLQRQVSDSTNRLFIIEGRTSSWNQVITDLGTETNRAIGVETNLSNRINTETNRAYNVETNLQRQISDSTNRIFVIEGRTSSWNQVIIDLGTETNRAIGVETNLSNRINTETNRAYNVETNLQAQINSNSNLFYNADTNLQRQVSETTNRVRVIEVNTQAWNNVATSVKFYANLGVSANQSINGTSKILYTNLILNVGGVYSNQVARWIPKVSGVMVRIEGCINADMANGATYSVRVYKNNSPTCTPIFKRAGNAADDLGATFAYYDITASTNDYYEIFGTTSANTPTTGSGTNNWWAGQIIY